MDKNASLFNNPSASIFTLTNCTSETEPMDEDDSEMEPNGPLF